MLSPVLSLLSALMLTSSDLCFAFVDLHLRCCLAYRFFSVFSLVISFSLFFVFIRLLFFKSRDSSLFSFYLCSIRFSPFSHHILSLSFAVVYMLLFLSLSHPSVPHPSFLSSSSRFSFCLFLSMNYFSTKNYPNNLHFFATIGHCFS